MTDLATLGFAVDSSPLARTKSAMQDMVPAARAAQTATDEFVDSAKRAKPAVDGLSDAARRAKPALDDVANSAGKTDSANRRATDSYTAHDAAVRRITGTYQQYSEVRARVDRITGVSTGSDTADLIQQGQAMDALRARFNPLFAAQRQYKQELIDIRGALRQGAISQKEYADAITNTKVAFTSQVNSLRGVTDRDNFFDKSAEGARRTGKAMQGLSFDARNLSFQLVDVAQGLAMGQSPMMIFAQQAGQIGQIAATSEKGIKGLFAEIGSGIAKVLTPMRLLTVGVIGFGIGALALIKNAIDSAKAMDDLAKSINTTRSLLHGLEQVAGGRGISTDDFAAGMKLFGDQVYLAKRNMGDLVGLFRANGIGPAKDLQDAMQKVADLVARTKDDQQAQKLLVEAGLPANEQWVRYTRDLAKGIDNATAGTVQFNDAAEQNMIAKAREFDKAWDSAITKLVNGFKAAAVTIGDALTKITVPDWLKTLLSLGATVATAVATMGMGPIGSAVSAGVAATKNYMSSGDSFSARFGAANVANDNSALQNGLDNWAKNFRGDYFRAPSTAGPAPKTRDELLNENRIAQQRISILGQMASVDDQVRAKELELNAAFLATGVGIGSRRKEMLELVREQALGITQIKAQADAYRLQANTIGMSIGQAAAYTAEQSRLNEATRNHQVLTEADKTSIRAAAQAMGEAAQASAERLAKDQALFDLQTAGLSGVEQQIAQLNYRLHGNDWQKYGDSATAQLMRIADAQKQLNDASKTFASDFVSGLREGKSAFDSLLGAASNFATKLANMGLDKMMSGLTGGGDFSKLFSGIGQSASQGIVEGFDAIQAKAAAAKANPANSFSFNGTGNMGMAGLAAVGAGLGIYAQGQQIGAAGGSPTSAALSGAITGGLSGGMLASMTSGAVAGPVGIAIGAVVGGIAGLLGASDGAKKAAQQAKDDWANAKTASDLFGKQLAGSGQGSLTTALAQAKSQTEQYTIMAQKAKDQDSSDRLGQQYNQYYKRMTEAFRDSFGGIVDAFNSGLGPNSPFATGAKNVKDIGDELKGFIEDTKTAMEYLAPGASGSAVAQATAAAQKYMLSLLGQAPVLTDTQTAIQHLNGTAAQLQTTLVDLGMSSKDAAAAIKAGVLASMKQLADTFANGIQREINAASGQDWKNSLSDLVAKFQSNLADAASLGLGPDLVNKWFKVSAQKIVEDAGLAGDAVAALVRQFPNLAGVITASVQSLQSLYDAATSQVDSARADLQKAYEAESSALQSTIDKTRAWIAQLKQFQQSLNIGQSSPYSPEQQYNLAKQQAQQDFALAMSGDQDAMERVQQDLSTYLDQSRSYNASSEQYFRDFKEAQDMLDKLQASGQRQIDTGQQQLDALNRQVSGLIDINNSVMSVTAAIAALQSALAGQKQAAGNLVNASPQSNIDALYQSVLGRSADAAGKAYWQQQVAAGLSGTDLTRSFISGAYAKGGSDAAAAAAYAKLHGYQNGGIVGMYANGGIVGNGIFNVDSALAKYASGGYIGLAGGEGVINANATRSLGGAPAIAALNTGRVPGNDNSAVVSEIKGLRAAVERLAAVIGLSDAETRKLLKEGNDVAEENASTLRLALERRAA